MFTPYVRECTSPHSTYGEGEMCRLPSPAGQWSVIAPCSKSPLCRTLCWAKSRAPEGQMRPRTTPLISSHIIHSSTCQPENPFLPQILPLHLVQPPVFLTIPCMSPILYLLYLVLYLVLHSGRFWPILAHSVILGCCILLPPGCLPGTFDALDPRDLTSYPGHISQEVQTKHKQRAHFVPILSVFVHGGYYPEEWKY